MYTFKIIPIASSMSSQIQYTCESEYTIIRNTSYNTSFYQQTTTNMNYLKEIEELISDLKTSHPKHSEELEEVLHFACSVTELLIHCTNILLSVRKTAHQSTSKRIDRLEKFCNSMGLYPQMKKM